MKHDTVKICSERH